MTEVAANIITSVLAREARLWKGSDSVFMPDPSGVSKLSQVACRTNLAVGLTRVLLRIVNSDRDRDCGCDDQADQHGTS